MPTEWGFGWSPVKSEWCKQTNRNEVYTSACGEQLSSLRHTGVDCYLDERKTIMARRRKMESWDMSCSSRGQVRSLVASFSAISNRVCQLAKNVTSSSRMIWVKYSKSFQPAITETISGGPVVLGLNYNCRSCTQTTWKCCRVGHRLSVVYSRAYGSCPHLCSLECFAPLEDRGGTQGSALLYSSQGYLRSGNTSAP